MQKIREIWQRLTTSRYARALEAFAHTEHALKEEIARLRAENRALLNSILGIAGIPPIVVTPAEAATEAAMLNSFLRTSAAPRSASSSPANLHADEETQRNRTEAEATTPTPPRPDKPESSAPHATRFKTASTAPRRPGPPHANTARFNGQPQRNISPMRRRSWQQINRMLEFESAKKKSQENL
jgi:hypothetical protein